MSLTQQDADPHAIHQPAPATRPAWMILTPIIALFTAGLRPLNFVISQGALAVAPLVALLGFDDTAEWFSYLYANEYTNDRANKIDGNVALGLRPAQNQTRDG